jgi:hypothetical protein
VQVCYTSDHNALKNITPNIRSVRIYIFQSIVALPRVWDVSLPRV